MKDLALVVDSCVHHVGEMSIADLDAAIQVLERGLIHVMVERSLRENDGVSRLHAVDDPSH